MNVSKLDRMFQETLMKENPQSIFGGATECIHHFLPKSLGLSLRWYVKDGIPVTVKQHNEIHGKDGKKMEERIIEIKGKEWLKDLYAQRMKLAKYAKEEDIIKHIKGEKENYAS